MSVESKGSEVGHDLNGSDEFEQSELSDFGFNFSEVGRWLRNNREDSEVWVTGDALKSDEYDYVSLVVAPKDLNVGSDYSSQQMLETNLMQNNDRESFELVANALREGLDIEVIREEGIPVNQEFTFAGTNFHVKHFRESKAIPRMLGEDPLLYPLRFYNARAERPSHGIEEQFFVLEQNLRDENKADFWHVVSTLKGKGATVYATGSVLETGEYNDIDLAVDASGIEVKRGSFNPVENPLPEDLGTRNDPVSRTIFDLKGEYNDRDYLETEKLPHEYQLLEKLYSFEFNGTEFDIGYDEDPFGSEQLKTANPQNPDDQTKYVKL